MSARPKARFRWALRISGVPAIASVGAAAACCIPAAHADLVPTLPTVTVPSLPVSLPTVPSVPAVTAGTTTTTAAASTTAPAGTTGSAAGVGQSGGPSGGLVVADSAVAGTTALPSGAVSVPASSVIAPARLVIDRITISPKWIGTRRQRVRIVARITDTRGYRVRDASVDAQSTPAGRITPVAAHLTSVDGTASLQLSTTSRIAMRTGSTLKLVIRAYVAGAPGSVVRRTVSLPIRPR
jgi:hypothetical protein